MSEGGAFRRLGAFKHANALEVAEGCAGKEAMESLESPHASIHQVIHDVVVDAGHAEHGAAAVAGSCLQRAPSAPLLSSGNFLCINVSSARDLQRGNVFKGSTCDPYVVVSLTQGRALEEKATRVLRNNKFPLWEESFQFQLKGASDDAVLTLTVRDRDAKHFSSFIGQVSLRLADIVLRKPILGEPMQYREDLRGKNGDGFKPGTLYFSVTFVPRQACWLPSARQSMMDPSRVLRTLSGHRLLLRVERVLGLHGLPPSEADGLHVECSLCDTKGSQRLNRPVRNGELHPEPKDMVFNLGTVFAHAHTVKDRDPRELGDVHITLVSGRGRQLATTQVPIWDVPFPADHGAGSRQASWARDPALASGDQAAGAVLSSSSSAGSSASFASWAASLPSPTSPAGMTGGQGKTYERVMRRMASRMLGERPVIKVRMQLVKTAEPDAVGSRLSRHAPCSGDLSPLAGVPPLASSDRVDRSGAAGRSGQESPQTPAAEAHRPPHMPVLHPSVAAAVSAVVVSCEAEAVEAHPGAVQACSAGRNASDGSASGGASSDGERNASGTPSSSVESRSAEDVSAPLLSSPEQTQMAAAAAAASEEQCRAGRGEGTMNEAHALAGERIGRHGHVGNGSSRGNEGESAAATVRPAPRGMSATAAEFAAALPSMPGLERTSSLAATADTACEARAAVACACPQEAAQAEASHEGGQLRTGVAAVNADPCTMRLRLNGTANRTSQTDAAETTSSDNDTTSTGTCEGGAASAESPGPDTCTTPVRQAAGAADPRVVAAAAAPWRTLRGLQPYTVFAEGHSTAVPRTTRRVG